MVTTATMATTTHYCWWLWQRSRPESSRDVDVLSTFVLGFLSSDISVRCFWIESSLSSLSKSRLLLDTLLITCLSLFIKALLYLILFERFIVDLFLDKVGRGYSKAGTIDHLCRECVHDLELKFTLKYGLTHHRRKYSTLKSLRQHSANHSSDYGYFLRVWSWFLGFVLILKDPYDGVPTKAVAMAINLRVVLSSLSDKAE